MHNQLHNLPDGTTAREDSNGTSDKIYSFDFTTNSRSFAVDRPSLPSDFLENLTLVDGCWVWSGTLWKLGYGRVGRNGYAHRLMFEAIVGPLPREVKVCHRCDNPPCVRPDHLFLGRQVDNIRDALHKGRMARKLTASAVSEILASPNVAGVTFAKRFGVSKSMISHIRNGRRWPHISRVGSS